MASPKKVPPHTNDYREIEQMKRTFQEPFSLRVSVIIPFYILLHKHTVILARTLASLVHQTYPAHLLEIIICDDGSTVSVTEVIESFQSLLDLKYVRQEDRGYRPGSARNLGIYQARGEVIISIDCDMICAPDFVETHLRWFHVSESVATIGTRRFIDADSFTPYDVMHHFQRIEANLPIKSVSMLYREKTANQFLYALLYEDPCPSRLFHTCNVAYRRSQALQIGGFDPVYDGHYGFEDIDFGHRLWRTGVFLVSEKSAIAYHQENTIVSYEERSTGTQLNAKHFFQKFPDAREIWDQSSSWSRLRRAIQVKTE